MKNVVHVVVIVIFTLFAYWQINDPDPLKWIPIYLGVSISALLFILERYLPLLPLVGVIVCLIGVLFLAPDFISWILEGMPTITGSMKAESPHIELVREFLGFLIAGAGYTLYFRAHKRNKSGG